MQHTRKRTSSGARHEGYLSTRTFRNQRGMTPQRTSRTLSPQQSAERAAHQRAADRSADRTADRFAEIGHDPADHLVGDRARDASRDDLARRHPAAPDIGAENRPDDRADLAQDPASPASAVRSIRRRSGTGDALLQYLVGGFGIDRRVVFALHRT